MLIQANKIRSKMCGPLSGMQKGQLNPAVHRDRMIASAFMKFKYDDLVVDDGNSLDPLILIKP